MTAMANSEYTKYSVDKLREWVSDALQTEATGEEIADAILDELQYEVEYHMEAMSKASDVLARLKAKRKTPDISFAKGRDWSDFWNSQPGPNETDIVTFS